MRVLILGGYGYFGGLLATLLADEPRLTLIIAGRSIDKARAFRAGLESRATLEPMAFDREAPPHAQLEAARPDVIIDASGPFQDYGREPYALVEAAIARGVGYMDFADASGFVHGIAHFDAAAKRRGVYVVSGVSSFPVLSAAVVRDLARGLARVDTITGGIAPSPHANVGVNVVRAICAYAGKPVRLLRDGRAATGYALTDGMRFTICPPGCLPLDTIWFTLVDVPDHEALPPMWPGLRSIWMGAGPRPHILHRALNALSWLARLGLVPTLAPFAPLFHRVLRVLRWGPHRGGMFMRVEGRMADGRAVTRTWHMLAEGDDGPFIPSMALEALVRRALDGRPPAPGARAATRELELADYEMLFSRRNIATGVRETFAGANDAPLYRRVLGTAFDRMPAALRAMHEPGAGMTVEGRANVERGSNLASRIIAALFGFPKAGTDVPLKVEFSVRDGREVWRRTFGDRGFGSVQSEGTGTARHLVCERFGPFVFGLATVVEGERLLVIPTRWWLLGLPLPAALMPHGTSYEWVDDGRFAFHVEIRLPLIGLLVRYRGTLGERVDDVRLHRSDR